MAFSLGGATVHRQVWEAEVPPTLHSPHNISIFEDAEQGVKTSSLLSESQHNTGSTPTLVELCVCTVCSLSVAGYPEEAASPPHPWIMLSSPLHALEV